jgi:hypothetical protein
MKATAGGSHLSLLVSYACHGLNDIANKGIRRLARLPEHIPGARHVCQPVAGATFQRRC